MKLSFLALALASMTIPGTALAHDVVPVVAAGNTLLTVSAEGKAAGKPDLSVFSAGVTSSGKTASEALAANSSAMTRAMAALKKAGIAERDIQTSDLSLYPVYANVPQQPGDMLEQQVPPIIGYRVNNTINVRQRKLDQTGIVIDTLVKAGANQVNGPSFQVEDNSAALDLARANAMQSARKRADLYAKLAGLRVLRIVSIGEAGGYAPPMQVMYARAAMADSAGAPPPVSAGEVQSNVNVTVLFELAP